ncbi:hypothetical protein BOX15_Mlig032507g1 [Macrostomum lignano]|uniref:Uncharacterized protein n=1 Tax=Macrostomum lignano TaxID=282301 RepID=A0A267EB51_9PLAT|nr:hypothetical protein BOX15_Mlig032507g1 [Macrostomum lignano]
MQQQNSALAPISEGAARAPQPPPVNEQQRQQLQPRRSLRYPTSVTTPLSEQPRRLTLMPAPTSDKPTTDGHVVPKQRRQSRRRPSSIRSSERSQGRPSAGVLAGLVENTFRMGPAQPFIVDAAEALIKERLETNLKRYSYNEQSAKVMSTNMAQEIKNKIKQQLLRQGPNSRYKLVVLVTVTDVNRSAGEFASRMLCQAATGDACAKAEFHGNRAAAWAAVFALYCE